MSPMQPRPGDNEYWSDSLDCDLVIADGPGDLTVRPMDPRLYRRPARPPAPQPPPEANATDSSDE
jgi:hypothetical protein